MTSKNLVTGLIGARVRYAIPVMELTSEQSAQMLVASKDWGTGADRDEKRRAVWPKVEAAVVNVYLVDGTPYYTLRVDRTGELVEASASQIEVV